jgi:hypothetical protein
MGDAVRAGRRPNQRLDLIEIVMVGLFVGLIIASFALLFVALA